MMKEYDLDRFVKAQEQDYETALKEIRQGCKRSHWIWYIFPQIAGLGLSSISGASLSGSVGQIFWRGEGSEDAGYSENRGTA